MMDPFHRRGLRSRLLSGIGANAYGQFVTLMIQLLSVPLFLYYWGVELYGEWLMVAAVPAYLTLSDIGFASVAANQMTMLVARGERGQAIKVYQSGIALISLISVVMMCLLAVFLFVWGGEGAHFRRIDATTMQWVLMLLSLQVFISLQGGMVSAGFRAAGKNAPGIIASNSIRAFEWLVVAVVVVRGGGLLAVAQVFLLCRAIGTLASWYALKRQVPWMRFGYQGASFAIVRTLIRPALAFMAFPLGLAMVMQGSILIIGSLLGAAAVAIFSAYRTLSRTMIQVMTAVSQAAWPEISAAHGSDSHDLVRRLHSKGVAFSFWLGLVAVLVLGLWGEAFIGWWTKDSFPHEAELLWGLLLAAFVNVLWQPSWVLLMATNNHSGISVFYVIVSLCFLGGLWLLASTQGLMGTGIALVFYESVLLLYVMRQATNVTSQRGRELFFAPFNGFARSGN